MTTAQQSQLAKAMDRIRARRESKKYKAALSNNK